MDQEKLNRLNDDIASLHSKDDVISYEIDDQRRIRFPWGFLRPLNYYRSFFPFLNKALNDKIAQHMMHRDTLHWIWLKTDIFGYARFMVVKFQLINLGAILEAIVKGLYPKMSKTKDDVYNRIDQLEIDKRISNAKDLKKLWEARRSIHLHLTEEEETHKFSDKDYIEWHNSMSVLIKELNKN